MTYAEAVARVLALRGGEHAGMCPGLERIETLLDALGRPERRYRLVQVAGTNGKGSVAAMLATALGAAGHRVGLYTSPHLVSFRERIRVNGEAIPEDAVTDGVDALGTLIARMDATMFEATTALALDHFARDGVEIAVLEAGMGGRLDATTVGHPEVTVISRIDLDHEAYLGRTLGAIAGEKAAILRSGVAVSAAQAPEAEAVIRTRAAETGVPVLFEGTDLAVAVRSRRLHEQRIDCQGPGWALHDVPLVLAGVHQPSNALLAVAAARALGAGEAAIREGLSRVVWPGRFQVIPGDPLLVLDGAHNPAGARALAASLRAYFPGRPLALVLAISQDKDARAMIEALAPLAGRVILARASTARAAEPAALLPLVPAGPRAVAIAESAAEALDLARRPPAPAVVCAAGSLFLVADVLARLGGGADKPCPIEKGAATIKSPFS